MWLVRMSALTIRQSSRRLDLFHIVLGLALLVMAVLAFVDPNTNMVLFPLIFFTAAAIKLVSQGYLIYLLEKEKKKVTKAAVGLIPGLLMLIIGIISAVSIW